MKEYKNNLKIKCPKCNKITSAIVGTDFTRISECCGDVEMEYVVVVKCSECQEEVYREIDGVYIE